MKTFFTSLFLLLAQVACSQQNAYNIYEIGKGEILKKDYFFLEHLHNNLLIAAPLKDGVNYNYADLGGVIDFKENIILPFQYRNIEKVRDDYNLYKENIPLIAISNGKGRALFRLNNNIFEQVTDFSYLQFRPYLFTGEYLNAYDGYCQILDLKNGKTLKTKFIETEPLTKDLISTKNMDYKWGVLDRKGDTILTNQFSRIRKISGLLVSVEKSDSIGILNNDGELIIPPVFKRIEISKTRILAETFNSGKKIELNANLKQKLSDWTATIKKDGKIHSVINSINGKNIQQIGFSGAFDFNGNLKIPFEYSLLEKGIGSEIIANKNGKIGIISENGNIVMDFNYDEITIILDKYYLVKNNGKQGLFTTNNKKILDVKYNKAFPISINQVLYLENNFWYKAYFSDKFEKIKVEKTKLNSKYNLSYMETISSSGNRGLENTDFFALTDSQKYGIIDKNLNIVIPITNNEEPRYFDGKCFDLDKKYTSKGIELKDIDLSDDELVFKNTIIGKKGKKYGVVNLEGKIVIPFLYSYIQNIDGQKFIVKK